MSAEIQAFVLVLAISLLNHPWVPVALHVALLHVALLQVALLILVGSGGILNVLTGSTNNRQEF